MKTHINKNKNRFNLMVLEPNILDKCRYRIIQYAEINQSKNLRYNYFQAINEIQLFPIKFSVNNKIHIEFGNLINQDRKNTIKTLMICEQLHKNWRFDYFKQVIIRKKVERGLSLLKDYDENLFYSIQSIVSEIIITKNNLYYGGSISSVLSAIWLNPPAHWTVFDYAEKILHEYIHQCIFLYEIVNAIYAVESVEILSREENQCVSALLKIKRPYDRALHSAFVSFVLINYWQDMGINKQYLDLINSLDNTINELNKKNYLLTNSGKKILDDLISNFNMFVTSHTLKI